MFEMRINRKNFMICMCIFVVLFICTLFHEIPFFSYVSLAAFVLFLYTMFTRMTHFMVTYFVFVFLSSGLIVGCALCEFRDAYLPEFGAWGHFVGSLPLLILLYVLLFLAIAFFDGINENRLKNTQNTVIQKNHYPAVCHYIAVLCVMIMLFLFLRIIRNPAFLMGYSRGEYAEQFGNRSGIFGSLDKSMYIFLAFALLDYMNGYKRTGKIGIVSYFLYYLWSGHKFGTFFNFAVIFIFVFHDRLLKIEKKRLTKFIRTAFVAIFLLLGLTSLLAVNMSSKAINWGTMLDFLLMRISSQGGIWYKTFEITDQTHLNEIDDEIQGMIERPAHPENYIKYGMYKMMCLCVEHKNKVKFINKAIETGYVFTEAACASSYYYLGTAGGIIFIIFHAFAISLTFNLLFASLRRNKVVRIILLLRMYNILRFSLFSLEYVSAYFNLLSNIGYVILIVGFWQDHAANRKSFQHADTNRNSLA